MSIDVKRSAIDSIMSFIEQEGHPAQFKINARKNLEGKTIQELHDLLAQIATGKKAEVAQTQDALLEVQAARAAERTAFDLIHNAPKRQEAEDADRTTFAEAAKTLRTFSLIEANYQMVRSTLGTGFSVSQIKEMTEANSTLLVSPNPHEINGWKYQDMLDAKAAEAQRVEWLKNIPHEQLREEVRQAGQQHAAATQQAFAQQQTQAMEEKCAGQFPPIPTHNASGEELSSSYFIKLSNSPYGSEPYLLWKKFVRKHGFANMTARIQGVR